MNHASDFGFSIDGQLPGGNVPVETLKSKLWPGARAEIYFKPEKGEYLAVCWHTNSPQLAKATTHGTRGEAIAHANVVLGN